MRGIEKLRKDVCETIRVLWYAKLERTGRAALSRVSIKLILQLSSKSSEETLVLLSTPQTQGRDQGNFKNFQSPAQSPCADGRYLVITKGFENIEFFQNQLQVSRCISRCTVLPPCTWNQ